jgi:hypothetical protein
MKSLLVVLTFLAMAVPAIGGDIPKGTWRSPDGEIHMWRFTHVRVPIGDGTTYRYDFSARSPHGDLEKAEKEFCSDFHCTDRVVITRAPEPWGQDKEFFEAFDYGEVEFGRRVEKYKYKK